MARAHELGHVAACCCGLFRSLTFHRTPLWAHLVSKRECCSGWQQTCPNLAAALLAPPLEPDRKRIKLGPDGIAVEFLQRGASGALLHLIAWNPPSLQCVLLIMDDWINLSGWYGFLASQPGYGVIASI